MRSIQLIFQTALKVINQFERVIILLIEILSQVDAQKEQEINDFLSKIRQNRSNDAKDGIQKLINGLASLDKRWKEVNDENDGFIAVLNGASNTKNKDKLSLIEQLQKESDGSKKDLIKIKQDAGKIFIKQTYIIFIDELRKFLNATDLTQIKLDDLHPLLQAIDKYSELVPRRLEDLN